MKGMRGLWLVSFLLGSWLAGCAHGPKGGIDVDQIQELVDEVEWNLRKMSDAVEAGDMDEAVDQLEEAREKITENQEQLTAYPEFSSLEEKLEKATADLCYGQVGEPLKAFFARLRDGVLDDARDSLNLARQEFARCEPVLKNRPDFMPLKMNLESAPKELGRREEEISLARLWQKADGLATDLRKEMNAVQARLEALSKDPNQKEFAQETALLIKNISARIAEAQDGLASHPRWSTLAADLNKELEALSRTLDGQIHRGKILWIASNLLPRAQDQAAQAARAIKKKNNAAAAALLQKALDDYGQCQTEIEASLKAEASLAGYKILVGGQKRSAQWLKGRCQEGKKTVEKTLKRLGAKPSAAAAKEPPAKEAVKPTTTPPKKKPKKPAKKKGRIDRW